MALDDIVFSEGDRQNFIEELPAGTLNIPADIVTEHNSVFGQMILEVLLKRLKAKVIKATHETSRSGSS
jgi:hypothetical protein